MAEANSETCAVKEEKIVDINERNKSEIVKLKEEDVPGATLPRNTPEECTVKQLQRWLLCRGAKTTGKKTQLVQRYNLLVQPISVISFLLLFRVLVLIL